MKEYWYRLAINLPRISEIENERFEELLWELGAAGIVTADSFDPAFAIPGEGGFHLKAYFLFLDEADETRFRQLEERLVEMPIFSRTLLRDSAVFSWSPVQAADHLESWKQFHSPQEVGKRFLVCPPWDVPTSASRDILVLDPSMAFGTGRHPTTLLMVEYLESHDLRRTAQLLDCGTGSAILAIIAAKQGATSVIGLDIDRQALDIAARNVKLSGLTREIVCVAGPPECLKPGSFDLVMANLEREIIDREGLTILSLVTRAGTAVFSGLLRTEVKALQDSFESAGFRRCWQSSSEEWAAFAVTRV